jgi:hypothetical protein
MGRGQAAARRVLPGLVHCFRREPLGGEGGTAGRARSSDGQRAPEGLAGWGAIGRLAVLRQLRGEAAQRAVALGQFRAPQGIDSRDHVIMGWTPDGQAWISAAVWNLTRHWYCQLKKLNVSDPACEVK